MLNLVREGEEDYIEAIRYRRRLKIFENFLFLSGDAHARRPLHKMDGVFFLSGDAHARRPLHKMDGVF